MAAARSLSATAQTLATALVAGERRALSKAITLVESTQPASREAADELLSLVLPQRDASRCLRLGISGPPGTGKSTLIESLGLELASRRHRLAVLAVDPSSHRSGGSVLGDKTRMPQLSANPAAFIRPSPAQGVLGGVARRTEDVALLCESGGYDRVVVETVGVGQSEVVVAGLVDMFVLLVPPGAGDGLQGIKRGIMELADLVVVTKCDGALKPVAKAAAQDIRAALSVLRPRDAAWAPRVITSSMHDPGSAAAVADVIEEFRATMGRAGALRARRAEQADSRVWEHCSEAPSSCAFPEPSRSLPVGGLARLGARARRRAAPARRHARRAGAHR